MKFFDKKNSGYDYDERVDELLALKASSHRLPPHTYKRNLVKFIQADQTLLGLLGKSGRSQVSDRARRLLREIDPAALLELDAPVYDLEARQLKLKETRERALALGGEMGKLEYQAFIFEERDILEKCGLHSSPSLEEAQAAIQPSAQLEDAQTQITAQPSAAASVEIERPIPIRFR